MYLQDGEGALLGWVRMLRSLDEDPLRGRHLLAVLEPGEGWRRLAPHLDLEGCHPVELHHAGAAAARVDGRGEVLVAAEVRLGLLAGVRLAGLGDGHHPELVLLTQAANILFNDLTQLTAQIACRDNLAGSKIITNLHEYVTRVAKTVCHDFSA